MNPKVCPIKACYRQGPQRTPENSLAKYRIKELGLKATEFKNSFC
jgi:hypothetical protein